ncbi:4-hydroxy-tetrahydrodipicolinate synthase [mine drainage metagenome]|uniref:4-hydroxy-tetrahydrodipicolinate synthase n=1 Tax=mine drainage metagenome TaxID=410659 RepID=A0A1J5SHE0_9ZZZZ
MSLKTKLRGTGVALITPFKSNGDVDFDALGKVIDYVIDGGVEYVITLGTTGETPVLDKQEKKDIALYTFEKVNFRVPVIVGIGGNYTNELIKDLHSFPLEKATAVLSASPYYSKPSQEGIFQHYKALASESPKPILLYNVPGRTGRNITAATTLRLAHEVENIAGIKEAHNDIHQCMEIIRDRPKDFLVVSGDDELSLPQISFGFDGVISVVANCFPKQFSQLIRTALKGNFTEASAAHLRLVEAYDYLFAENNPAGVKAFLYELGIIENNFRLPVVPVSAGLQEKIKKFIKEKL